MVLIVKCYKCVFTVNGKWIGIAPAYDIWMVESEINYHTVWTTYPS